MTKKTLLVTGAASGIGAGIAERFAADGYRVALFDLNRDGLERMQGVLDRYTDVLPIAGDVSIPADAERAAASTVDRFGSIDVLINNAGIEIAGTVATLSFEDWDRLIGVNLRGSFNMSKFALRVMPPGSSIVNISSVHAFAAYKDCAAYDASKSALLGLTRAMALDHAAQGVRVNAICPGYIQTPLLDQWLDLVEDRAATFRFLESIHPVGRIGTPLDVAEAALFFALQPLLS